MRLSALFALALIVIFFVVGCERPDADPQDPETSCSVDALESETALDVGHFELERDYQTIRATHTDQGDSYRFTIARPGEARIRAMASPVWSTFVKARVVCEGGIEPTACGGAGHIFEGACIVGALDLANLIVACPDDRPAELVVDVSPVRGGNDACRYSLDVAVTP